MEETSTVWDLLNNWEGKWMWEWIENDGGRRDTEWIVNGMREGCLLWIADGSYKRKIAPHVSGVGWIIYCTRTQQEMKGRFFEVCKEANAYRAEQLGLCALHNLIAAFSVFYKIDKWNTRVGCDNYGAIKVSKRRLRRIRPGMSCADILRNIKKARGRMTTVPFYFHVYGHMERFLRDDQLTLEQLLNIVCDGLAKSAVDMFVRNGTANLCNQLLPAEDAAVIREGVKVRGDISGPIRYALGKVEAKRFLVKEEKWTPRMFEEVDWDNLNHTSDKKPDGYESWLFKQHTGICATGVQLGYYSGIDNPEVGCPNCEEQEDSKHLCQCPDEGRTAYLGGETSELEAWLRKDDKTDCEIAYWIPKFIKCRGVHKMEDLGDMSEGMKTLAISQDIIGWHNFMEGRISKHFYNIQCVHLAMSSSYLNGKDWTKQFIDRILRITHSQWIYRNVCMHDKKEGYLHHREMEEMKDKAEELAETNPADLPRESRYLLEMDGEETKNKTYNDLDYWIRAVEAAKTAGRRIGGKKANKMLTRIQKKVKWRD